MRARHVVATVIGAFLALFGLAVSAAGAGALWAHSTQRDAEGYYSSPTFELATDGYAVVADHLDVIASETTTRLPFVDQLETRLEVTTRDGSAVFVGVARETDLHRYLEDVAYDEVSTLDAPVATTRGVAGAAAALPPASFDGWVATAESPDGHAVLDWAVQDGRWAVAVLHPDATPGLELTASAGVRTGLLWPVGWGMVAFGLLVLLAGALTVGLAVTRGPDGGSTTTPPVPSVADPAATARPAAAHPLQLRAELDPDLSRWMWLVKWFLAIPHLVVLTFLWAAFGVLTVVAGFAILFTGRYPSGIFAFNVGVLRWTWRVTAYAFGLLNTDRYPPFTLAATDGHAQLEVAEPGRLSRGLVLVKWWLLVLPHLLVVALLTGGLAWTVRTTTGEAWQVSLGGGVIGLLVVIAAVILAVRGTYPRDLFDVIVGLQRWVYRVVVYAALMTDTYPPFRLDLGGEEPTVPSGPPPPPSTAPTVPRAPVGAGSSR